MRVTGVHANPIRAYAYMDRSRAAALGLAGLANRVILVPDPRTPASTLQRELFGEPGIASVQPASAAADALQTTVESFSGAIQMVVFITLGLGLLVAFTSASVSLDERRREYATMFAFGLPPSSGLRVAVVESLVTGALGTIVGFGIGLAVAGWIVGSLLSETFPDLGFQTTLTARSVLTAVVVGVGAVALAPLFTFRRMRRMDVPSTLRAME
jgi:putative ABC transport system permease protein